MANKSHVDVVLHGVQVANAGLDRFSYDAAGAPVTAENPSFTENASGSGVKIANSALAPRPGTLRGREANGSEAGFQPNVTNSTYATPGYMTTVAKGLTANENSWRGVNVEVGGASSASPKDAAALRNTGNGLGLNPKRKHAPLSVNQREAIGTVGTRRMNAAVVRPNSAMSGTSWMGRAYFGRDSSSSCFAQC
ncbi:hypothetical protein [Paeniglutamicibacter cryotolerans]|uniref:Uncharacterized protein n=1 Tax=Paeniglutamicibacter cryotolerans TaxID=670079 RepID=A0A839QK37_9MICC|nr:hypothetical protein [Paeniglutamicibacter cryotolerans]MBB2996569.1 hypothetical protein [Paeniglutamicibacter cryotolerans]